MDYEYEIRKMEKYADEKGIPIMEKDGIIFLTEFVKLNNVKNILEIGTATGISAINMALVDENITITTIERDKDRYIEAVKNVKKLNLDSRITLILADALNFNTSEEYDLIFIDAAKSQYIKFFEKFSNNLKEKGYIVTDNINFHGLTNSDKSKMSRNLRGLITKLEKYIGFLRNNDEFKTRFFEVGDGIAISRRRKRMNKILLKINKDEELTYPADGYVLGIKGFSYLFGKTYDYDEIKKIKDNTSKELFVSFNKIVFNDELEEYKNLLKKVDELGIDGIIVGDVAALTYNLNTKIILDQLHLNNSYYTINHYYNNNAIGVLLTNDITLKEINEIKNNTNALLFKEVFGYSHLSTSNRKLITNYLENFNINSNKKLYEIKEDSSDSYYKIFEDDFGTHILSDKVLNLLGVKIDVDYKIISGLFIDDIKEVLDIFMNNDVSKKEYLDNKYNADTGFIDKETIYKVKDDEK